MVRDRRIVIGTVEVPVDDVRRAQRWYEELLDLECAWFDEAHALLHPPGSKSPSILLVQTADPTRLGFEGSNAIRHAGLDFGTTDLDGLHARLLARGVDADALEQPAHDWAPRGFGFIDSEGNRLAAFEIG